MKNSIGILILLILTLSITAQNPSVSNLYVGSFTSEGAEGIYLCQFDNSTGKISLHKVFKGIEDPSFIRLSPDRNFLYAVTRASNDLEKSVGNIQSYRIEPDGNLVFLNKQVSNGEGPCHVDISPDGRFAAIATYGSGTVSLYPLNEDGSLKKASITIHNTGSGAHPTRQTKPHAHSTIFSPDGKQLFSADLGTDKINIFNVKDNKIISAGQSYLNLTPGAGPRHFKFHPNGKLMYVINELNSTITTFSKKGRKWKTYQTITTIPVDFTEENYCADIHVSPDGRYLYGSNRGHNSIAVYTINPKSKKLEWVTAVSSQGDWPRNFTLSNDGKFLLAANQRSGNIAVFKINPENGIPEFTGYNLELPAPVSLEFQ